MESVFVEVLFQFGFVVLLSKEEREVTGHFLEGGGIELLFLSTSYLCKTCVWVLVHQMK